VSYEKENVLIAHGRKFMALYIANMLDDTDFRVVANLSGLDEIDEIPSDADPSVCIVGSGSSILSDLCVTLRIRFPSSRLMLVDAGEVEEMGRVARSLGLDGCLSLDLPPKLLLSGLRLVAAGTRCFPQIEEARVSYTALQATPPSDRRSVTLTPREKSVLRLIGKGMANKVIARDLGIAESTVKAHLNAVLRKTGTSNRTQVARWAFLNGQIV